MHYTVALTAVRHTYREFIRTKFGALAVVRRLKPLMPGGPA
jgi:hypothetical protein